MAAKVRVAVPYVVVWFFCAAFVYRSLFLAAMPGVSSGSFRAITAVSISEKIHVINEYIAEPALLLNVEDLPLSPPRSQLAHAAILLPGWEVLVIASTPSKFDGCFCLFETAELSPARLVGELPFSSQATLNCEFPIKARSRLPFKQPALLQHPHAFRSISAGELPPMPRWSFLAYESLTTEEDVVLFVKGVNRNGRNRKPSELLCVFGDGVINGVKTAVTASAQDVFRCERRNLPLLPVQVSLEIVSENKMVPSVTFLSPPRTLPSRNGKRRLCATTMVYNSAKFLREWILYHSQIGVEKFLLYDNASYDDLQLVVRRLVSEGFDVSTYYWPWPKTQEAGFSHSSLYASSVCEWMMFLDVDEFLYSRSWRNLPSPSNSLLHSLIPANSSRLGQITIPCHEFGPSGLTSHPEMGVTQGYDWRRRNENRHKSLVLLEAIDHSLLNSVHYFQLRPGYASRRMNACNIVVNHYKYQAWTEFKVKFRRRASANVVDWTEKANALSKDRTPGLGFAPVEPENWPQKFCEVHDDELKKLARKWFGVESTSGHTMAWQ